MINSFFTKVKKGRRKVRFVTEGFSHVKGSTDYF